MHHQPNNLRSVKQQHSRRRQMTAQAAAITGAHVTNTAPTAHWRYAGTSRGARKHGTAVGCCMEAELICIILPDSD